MNNSQVGMDPIPVGSWRRAQNDAGVRIRIGSVVVVESSG